VAVNTAVDVRSQSLLHQRGDSHHIALILAFATLAYVSIACSSAKGFPPAGRCRSM